MTIPSVTQPGTGPDRVQAPEDYDAQTTAYRIAFNVSVGEMNAAITALNALGITVDADATAVETARGQVAANKTAVDNTKGEIDAIKEQIDLQEAAVIAATGLDVSAFNIGDLLQVVDDGAGGKELAMSAQRLENSAPFTGATPSLDIAADQYHHGTLTGNTTFTFDVSGFGALSGSALFFALEVTQDSTLRTITFPASVEWDGGTPPDVPVEDATALYTFASRDGGTTWRGALIGSAFA